MTEKIKGMILGFFSSLVSNYLVNPMISKTQSFIGSLFATSVTDIAIKN